MPRLLFPSFILTVIIPLHCKASCFGASRQEAIDITAGIIEMMIGNATFRIPKANNIETLQEIRTIIIGHKDAQLIGVDGEKWRIAKKIFAQQQAKNIIEHAIGKAKHCFVIHPSRELGNQYRNLHRPSLATVKSKRAELHTDNYWEQQYKILSESLSPTSASAMEIADCLKNADIRVNYAILKNTWDTCYHAINACFQDMTDVMVPFHKIFGYPDSSEEGSLYPFEPPEQTSGILPRGKAESCTGVLLFLLKNKKGEQSKEYRPQLSLKPASKKHLGGISD